MELSLPSKDGGKREGWANLSKDNEAGLMRSQGKHDEISVQAVQAVASVGIPVRPTPLLANIRHDLVLSLPWHIGIRQHHLHTHKPRRRTFPAPTRPHRVHNSARIPVHAFLRNNGGLRAHLRSVCPLAHKPVLLTSKKLEAYQEAYQLTSAKHMPTCTQTRATQRLHLSKHTH